MEPWERQSPTPPDDKRPCWECLRRRLVCDYTRPTCMKCVKSGIVCPGFGNAKPLKWLTPGSVTFRRRKDVPTRSYPTSGISPSTGYSSKSSRSDLGGEAGSPQSLTEREQGYLSSKMPREDLKCDTTDIVQAVLYCMRLTPPPPYSGPAPQLFPHYSLLHRTDIFDTHHR